MAAHDPAVARTAAQARFRRGMFLLPSLFTVGNIAAGYFAITQTIAAIGSNGDAPRHLDWAGAIPVCGPSTPWMAESRMINTTSDFGKSWTLRGHDHGLREFCYTGFLLLPVSGNFLWRIELLHAGAFICFLYLIGGASRLARFNISPDAQPRNPGRPGRKYFVGMPIPAAAGLLAATVHFFGAYPNQAWWVAVIWLLIVGMCGYLMVSTWRFWSGKEINFSRSHPFQVLLLLAVVLSVILRFRRSALRGALLTCSVTKHGPLISGRAGGKDVRRSRLKREPRIRLVTLKLFRKLRQKRETRVQDCNCRRFYAAGQRVEGRHLGVLADCGHVCASGRRRRIGKPRPGRRRDNLRPGHRP